jgi:hypothetical protein
MSTLAAAGATSRKSSITDRLSFMRILNTHNTRNTRHRTRNTRHRTVNTRSGLSLERRGEWKGRRVM